ncbi:MAG: NAD-dependent epimerase/dehydratase family protein [Saprospiraceae bacterium]|nr:NAD-dependent epimerase/dehydratase family protein [Saprospiraceae bacterium]
MSKKVIITGSTGMVGRGILIECLESDKIKEVLLINRRPVGINHQKLKELMLKDFSDFSTIRNELSGYDACFYSMGVSALGMKEEDYSIITFDYTKNLADLLHDINPSMVFNYVSGSGTDSSEKGNIMWARVKGKTENYILNKGFKDAYAFRPGAIIPEKGIKSSTGWYQFFYVITIPFYPLLKKLKSVTTSSRLGMSMINTLFHSQELKHLENKDINLLAKK